MEMLLSQLLELLQLLVRAPLLLLLLLLLLAALSRRRPRTTLLVTQMDHQRAEHEGLPVGAFLIGGALLALLLFGL